MCRLCIGGQDPAENAVQRISIFRSPPTREEKVTRTMINGRLLRPTAVGDRAASLVLGMIADQANDTHNKEGNYGH